MATSVVLVPQVDAVVVHTGRVAMVVPVALVVVMTAVVTAMVVAPLVVAARVMAGTSVAMVRVMGVMPAMAVPIVAPVASCDGRVLVAGMLRRRVMHGRRWVARHVGRRHRDSRRHARDRTEHVHVRPVGVRRVPRRLEEGDHVGTHDAREAGNGEHVRRRQGDRAQDGVHRHDGTAQRKRRDHAARSRNHPRPCRFAAPHIHGSDPP